MKLVFSVDDDIDDDLDEETVKDSDVKSKSKNASDLNYLEGYTDAIKALQQKKKSFHSYFPDFNKLDENESVGGPKAQVKSPNVTDLDDRAFDFDTRKLNDNILEVSEDVTESEVGEDAEAETENHNSDTESVDSSSSSQTLESLNLRERQNAINSTHPFGIKIWKPSLYKKKRSVADRADEDIHAFDPHKPNATITWGVILTNYLWTLTFGLLIFLICTIGAAIVFVFSGFAIHRSLRPYVRLLLKLGKYGLWPFGKFVLLNRDENYLDEDELDGRSITEFHKWRVQEEGRLFFAPPRRYTTSNETRPLIKDHTGRPLRDAYSSLGEVDSNADDVIDGDDIHEESNDIKVRFFGRGSWSSGRFMFYIFFYSVLQNILYLIGFFCWLFVFTIPMANITNTICDHLRRHPLALDFELEKSYYKRDKTKKRKNQLLILCTYRSCGFHYYKYTIDGTNIFFINLLAAVAFVILDYYLLKEKLGWKTWFTDPTFLFCSCLFSIIPLAYFIGQAVASISAQSSMGVGAVINAFFSTIVEIFLYCVALNQSKGKLVEGSMIGSVLGGVLLLPGLSMCGGALKRKTQRYNPRSAGVSSTMLLFAMVTMFAPSLFYQIYGAYELKCKKCDEDPFLEAIKDNCVKCRFIQPSLSLDALYFNVIQPFSLIVALALFAAYVCGLYFTLRTHASLIWATNSHEAQAKKEDLYLRSPSIASIDTPKGNNKHQQLAEQLRGIQQDKLRPSASRKLSLLNNDPDYEGEEDGGGHDAPNWSRNKSTVILLGATLIYAIIAEILVDNVDDVLADFPIDPKFLGLTVFALVPNTTEFLNAISFAIGGNVALSMEIGSAYALQVVLIQIPSLVLFTIYKAPLQIEQMFSLVFPRWDIIATLISIYLFTYIYAEGKSNYFKGVILILIYAVVLVGFWFNDKIEALDDEYTGNPQAYARALSFF
ncbi:uncharacterized protein CANTADRAFT_77847 [Suhomyces tanzawaensis NRRL Y-17324]|uniref:Calcium permease n=1 Tax=Suhomyces tanzawaensis NRRL Y-17324 TaxID=984487 RepID=A0A1E4SJ89_9ASCO|nr:uncharacterized protein CANTADRAFT_77847 [Suhomyces tanzawaensis NRRL Y-17324]ODV79558.1 hypothetical protein CANTADRAFT_77847 [Suhomyces tanzawaensis NRRL Y-17324]